MGTGEKVIMADQYRMSAVILCGGKSRRMGTDKAMLTREGTPNAVRLLNALSGEDSPCTEVWLSIGTGESYPDIHAQKISDRYPGCGPMGGLEAALTVCREEYLFVTPVDTPFADAQMARELMTYMADASRQRDAVLVVDGGGRLQTLLGIYHKRVLPSLTQRLADGRKEKLRMRDFLRELDVVYVNAQELTDGVRKSTGCNTPQEWERLMEQESPRGGTEQVIVSVNGSKSFCRSCQREGSAQRWSNMMPMIFRLTGRVKIPGEWHRPALPSLELFPDTKRRLWNTGLWHWKDSSAK